MYHATTLQKREAFSDLYKDVTGFRPNRELYAEVGAMTDTEFEAYWDHLIDCLQRVEHGSWQ
jgi:hypothetical protein